MRASMYERVSLPIWWPADFVNMTHMLSVFHKSFSWKQSWCCIYFLSLSGGDVETRSGRFQQNDQSKTGHIHKFKDSCCKSVLSVPKSQHTNPNPLLPSLWSNSRKKTCTRPLRSCRICRFLFELFAEVFLRPKCVCQAQHMIMSPPIVILLSRLCSSFGEQICGVYIVVVYF